MGIVNDGTDTHFSSRARVAFNASGETDGGLSFGASFRADNAIGASGGTAGSVFLSGAFGKLSMGNVAGAAEAAVGDLSGVGYTGLGDYSDTVFLTGDGVEVPGDDTDEPIAQYAYTAGDLSVYLSTSDGVQRQSYAVGVGYTMGDYNFGLAYESTDDAFHEGVDGSHVVASLGGTFGAISAKAVYGQADVDGLDVTQYGASATYTMDALAVTGFYKTVDNEYAGTETDAIGLGAAYDLGGGAAVKGGVVNVDNGTTDDSIYDLGVSFTF